MLGGPPDNLRKRAATQALQNANLACGFEELAGMGINKFIAEKTP